MLVILICEKVKYFHRKFLEKQGNYESLRLRKEDLNNDVIFTISKQEINS